MNPSYTNGVGQQVPQNNPLGNAQQGGSVQQSVSVQQGGSVQQGNYMQQGGQMAQPTQMRQMPAPQMPLNGGVMQQPISSGTGDVILGGGTPKKKPRKGVIVLIVLVVLLVLAGVGYLLWQNGVFGGGGNSQQDAQTTDVRTAYNGYVNYVLYGENSTEKYEIDGIDSWTPYFVNLKGDELDFYVEEVNKKYIELENAYFQSDIANKVDITPMRIFYQDYAAMQPMTEEEASNMYLENGFKQTETIINNKYIFTDDNSQFKIYTDSVKNYLDNYLTLLVNADKAGCVQNKKIIPGCYKLSSEEYKLYQENELAVGEAVDALRKSAVDALKNVYNELYGSNENTENENA